MELEINNSSIIKSNIGDAVISNNIFNVHKTDYEVPSLFLGQSFGLVDSVNKHYPELFELYKKLKNQDWDENEFNFTTCLAEFKTVDPNIAKKMITTLAWQWEADTIAARTIFAVTAPFLSSDVLNFGLQRIGDSENTHSLTYSEIVRNSFEDSGAVIDTILKDQEALKRVSIVTEIFNDTYITGHKLALGMVEKNQETYNVIFMFFVAMYCLERIQFMNSFTVTFSIAQSGNFVPIGEAVKKICNDELEIHAKFARAILSIELKTQRGRVAFSMLKDKIQLLLDTVVETELKWVYEHLFADGIPLERLTPELLADNCLYNAAPVYNFFGLKYKKEFPKENKLSFLDGWIKIDKSQESAQELRGGRYFLGGFKNDHKEVDYSYFLK